MEISHHAPQSCSSPCLPYSHVCPLFCNCSPTKENKLVLYFPCTHWSMVKLLLASPPWGLHSTRRYQLCRTMQLLARDGGPTLPCPCHCLYHCALAGEGPSQVSTTHEHHHGFKREPRPWVCAWSLVTKVTDISMAPGRIKTTNPLIPLSGCMGREPPQNLTRLYIPLLR